ncbi:MAG: hypothetical protein ACR2QK_02710, partial [Acidimicrobiales bacterium]
VMVCRRPRLWLLDEPHGGLDQAGRNFVDDLIHHAIGFGATVLIASHDIERATDLATRIVTIAGGQIQDQGRKHDPIPDSGPLDPDSLNRDPGSLDRHPLDADSVDPDSLDPDSLDLDSHRTTSDEASTPGQSSAGVEAGVRDRADQGDNGRNSDSGSVPPPSHRVPQDSGSSRPTRRSVPNPGEKGESGLHAP